MGFFSWKTSDTKRSISNVYSNKEIFVVYMKTEDGRVWQENAYEGYGVFGGKDIYELIAELNNLTGKNTEELRNKGISLVFENNRSGDFTIAAINGIKLPQLFENKESNFNDYPFPDNCYYQGYFYDDIIDE